MFTLGISIFNFFTFLISWEIRNQIFLENKYKIYIYEEYF